MQHVHARRWAGYAILGAGLLGCTGDVTGVAPIPDASANLNFVTTGIRVAPAADSALVGLVTGGFQVVGVLGAAPGCRPTGASVAVHRDTVTFTALAEADTAPCALATAQIGYRATVDGLPARAYTVRVDHLVRDPTAGKYLSRRVFEGRLSIP
jgi:hypothetical protein